MNENDRRESGRSFFKIVIGVCITITASWFLWISTTTIDNSKEIAIYKNTAIELKKTLEKYEISQKEMMLKLDKIREEQIALIAVSVKERRNEK